MESILLLNARRRVFLVEKMKEYIKENDLPIKILACDSNEQDPIRFFSDGFKMLPPIKDDSFLNELEIYVISENIIGMMVWNDNDFSYIQKKRQIINSMGIKILMPDDEALSICNDKRKTNDFITALNILTPFIHDFNELTELDQSKFPLFIKPYDGSGSMFCYKLEDIDSLRLLYKQVPNPIIQDFIEGTHYTVDLFCNLQYEPLAIVPRKRLKVRDSEALIAKIALEDDIVKISYQIAKSLKIIGPMKIQYIKNSRGELFLIEINPRISGGLDLSI
ncbi:MAG: ATP-grasp domain-containing protein, partial [Bacteroidales bacterium]|nr:ATP-grasp domain-containing protein [Bacteroidales bacterium]